jgi:uncharacterized protein
MDAVFQPAMDAARRGDVDRFVTLLNEDASLATARSSVSHPTLLQFLVLETVGAPTAPAMAKALIERGAEIHKPLIAAASIDNPVMVELLLDAGGSIDGDGRWSPLEEALYWDAQGCLRVLLSRGAAVKNLRTAAALGRMDTIRKCFHADGSLNVDVAGTIESPFEGWFTGPAAREPQAIIDNAFVYACMHGQLEAVEFLLERGAGIDAIPPGFDFAGTGLHYAAHQGERATVEFLLKSGADPTVKDRKVHVTPASWAEHGKHPELQELLEGEERRWAGGKR